MTKNSLKKISTIQMESVAVRFRALGEVSRLLLIEKLLSGEKSVTELVELTGLSQPNVSRHLSILVSAELISRKKDGLNVIYKVTEQSLAEICNIICKTVSK